MTENDEDALWRSIVENYGERVTLDVSDKPPAAAGHEPGPVAEPDTGEPDPGESSTPTELSRETRRDRHTDLPLGTGRDGPDLLDAYDDPEDHFVPPEPPHVPAPEPPRLLAWAGVLGVPVLVLLLVVLRVPLPSWGSLLCVVWFIGGFGYLVATMRREPGPDDDWDDGARL